VATSWAQDVTVGPVVAESANDTPEVLPTLVKKVRPEFPSELKKTADIGWASIDCFVDDHGKVLTWNVSGSQPAYADAAQTGFVDTKKFTAGQKNGVPVNSRIRLSVSFNPASASPKNADATPRLLNATVVVDPHIAPKPSVFTPPITVWATLSVDAEGHVVAVKDLPERQRAVFEEAARHWSFAPARKAGVPIAADVRVPFIVVSGQTVPPKNLQPPRWVTRADPEYPFALRMSGLRGNVTVEFVVDQNGRTRDVVVVSSLNPAFNESAIAAVQKWKFEPGRADGVPVNTKLRQEISFQLDTVDGGDTGFVVTNRADQSKLPENLRYDVAPKPKAFVLPVYPYELLKKRVRGKAKIGILLDDRGMVIGSKISSASQPELGFALQAAAERFEYEPALKSSQPTQALVGFEQEFKLDLTDLVSETDRRLLRLEEKHPEQILKGAELDQKLKSTVTSPPRYPLSLADKGVPGQAVVDCLIDEHGEVHLPRIVSSTNPEFGYAAVQALRLWRFVPPVCKGKPGVTKVRIPFGFEPPRTEPAASGAVAEPKPQT
jgi:TonB family protein